MYIEEDVTVKLLLIVIHDENASHILEGLTHQGYRVIKTDSSVVHMEQIKYIHFPEETGLNVDLSSRVPIAMHTGVTIFVINADKIEAC